MTSSYLVDQNGFLSQSFSYDLAGNVTKTRGFIDTPLKYRGEYQDTDTLYLYLRARHYDPQTSTFLTRDPLEEISRSAYNYANADPLAVRIKHIVPPEDGVSIGSASHD